MECERSNPTDPLRQGDIIAAQPQTDAWRNPWKRFAIVMSADCDLAQNKTGPDLVVLPVISHHTYLADVWLPIEAAKCAEKGRSVISKTLSEFDAQIEYRHIDAWAASSAGEEIAVHLREYLGKKKNAEPSAEKMEAIRSIWQSIQILTKLSTAESPTQTERLRTLLDEFFRYRNMIEPTPKGDPTLFRRNFVQKALVSTQDRLDTWLIRELIGLDPDMLSEKIYGFVVSLRSIQLVSQSSIVTERARWYGERDRYLRICRLRGLYKADLVQQFANLFMRVGLEDHRHEEHRRMFQKSAEDLFPGEPP